MDPSLQFRHLGRSVKRMDRFCFASLNAELIASPAQWLTRVFATALANPGFAVARSKATRAAQRVDRLLGETGSPAKRIQILPTRGQNTSRHRRCSQDS